MSDDNENDPDDNIDEDALEIRIPGTFVVLQGLPGDGMCNTMDRLPNLPLTTTPSTAPASASASTPTPMPLTRGGGGGHHNNRLMHHHNPSFPLPLSSMAAMGGTGALRIPNAQPPSSSAAAAAPPLLPTSSSSNSSNNPQTISTSPNDNSNETETDSFIVVSDGTNDDDDGGDEGSGSVDSEDAEEEAEAEALSRSRRRPPSPPTAPASSTTSTTTSTTTSASPNTTILPSPPASIVPEEEGVIQQQQQQQQQQLQSQLLFQQVVEDWKKECRRHEQLQRREFHESLVTATAHQHHHHHHPTQHSSNHHSHGNHHHSQSQNRSSILLSSFDWLQCPESGRLSVLDQLPTKSSSSSSSSSSLATTVTQSSSLAPGTTVVATKLVTLHAETLEPIFVKPIQEKKLQSSSSSSSSFSVSSILTYPPGRLGWVQFLFIESPVCGYVVLSSNGYVHLAPGLPSTLLMHKKKWWWRVTCPVGAIIRQGLDLSTQHVTTVPYGSLLKVKTKTINAMGLSRLFVQAVVYENAENDNDNTTTRTTNTTSPRVFVEGWCSEFLNPLSGQRGTIVQPLPFCVPALYRVVLPQGAVVRAGVELSSAQIGHAPQGCLLAVTGRAFAEHPSDCCVDRLRLAAGNHHGGWVSVRLNMVPPHDQAVVEFAGMDGSFDPNEPGRYHIEALLRVRREQQQRIILNDSSTTAAAAAVDAELLPRTSFGSAGSGADLSSIDESADSSASSSAAAGEGIIRQQRPTTTSTTTTTNNNICRINNNSTIYSPAAIIHRDEQHNNINRDDMRCLICLSEERTATLVHGETGHIACCLVCARILKARRDPCPVCRLPIDSVIQHFWA